MVTVHSTTKRLITADDRDPRAGGMSHVYTVRSDPHDTAPDDGVVRFQHGPVKEAGINGIQHADLYRMIIDRLECAQASPWACEENAGQLDHLRAALAADERRTARRVSAGTEGTSADR